VQAREEPLDIDHGTGDALCVNSGRVLLEYVSRTVMKKDFLGQGVVGDMEPYMLQVDQRGKVMLTDETKWPAESDEIVASMRG